MMATVESSDIEVMAEFGVPLRSVSLVVMVEIGSRTELLMG